MPFLANSKCQAEILPLRYSFQTDVKPTEQVRMRIFIVFFLLVEKKSFI